MDYEYHIFVSYAHGDLWTRWVKEMFVPRLQAYLQLEVGRLNVFVDEEMQTGTRWESVLKRKVARSKLMLSLLSAQYFQREWCLREMAVMFDRERLLGLASHNETYDLLIPVRLGGGAYFPDLVRRIKYLDFEDYADPDLPAGSSRSSDFNQHLKHLAQIIAGTLAKVPPYESKWEHLTGEEFLPQLEPKALETPRPPRLII